MNYFRGQEEGSLKIVILEIQSPIKLVNGGLSAIPEGRQPLSK